MPRFVIQQHRATTLHWDLRLEIGGTYVSWAVPKGPSTDPAERRLAVRVEDHSIGWGDFEGRIGAGYGAGAVIVWDRGDFENRTEREGEPVGLEEGLASGYLAFEVRGEKMRGEWSLRHWKTKGEREHWLLRKRRDEWAGSELPAESVKSGRRIEELG